jgi:hypothetical protein
MGMLRVEPAHMHFENALYCLDPIYGGSFFFFSISSYLSFFLSLFLSFSLFLFVDYRWEWRVGGVERAVGKGV